MNPIHPVDRVLLTSPRRQRQREAPDLYVPRTSLALLSRDLRRHPPTPEELADMGQLAELARSTDPLLRRVVRETASQVGQELHSGDRVRLRVDRGVLAVGEPVDVTRELMRTRAMVGPEAFYEARELAVSQLLERLSQAVGQGPVPEEALRTVALLARDCLNLHPESRPDKAEELMALQKHAEPCLDLLSRWRDSGQIQADGDLRDLCRGPIRVEGTRLGPGPLPGLSPLSRALVTGKKKLPHKIPPDLEQAARDPGALAAHPGLLKWALKHPPALEPGFLERAVQQGALDDWDGPG
ncbi:MAG: hypothetical protein AB1758_23290, partial [Candidatus Eremiobacterota bacterium]